MPDDIQPVKSSPPDKPSGAKKFFKVLGLVATLRFADAVEYANNGDTEN